MIQPAAPRFRADTGEIHRADEALDRAFDRLHAVQDATRRELFSAPEWHRRRRRRLAVILLMGVGLIALLVVIAFDRPGMVARTLAAALSGFGAGALVAASAAVLARRRLTSYESVKRMFDLAISWAALVFLLPILGLVALILRLQSPGLPVLTSELRVGRYGKMFKMRRFRVVDVASDGVGTRSRFGWLLVATDLHSLPMLFNVLNGDMSVVGPSPRRPESLIAGEASVPNVKPGLTGLAVVRGARSLREAEAFDRLYERSRGPITDLRIIALTFASVFQRRTT